jgi:hypothetical protein
MDKVETWLKNEFDIVVIVGARDMDYFAVYFSTHIKKEANFEVFSNWLTTINHNFC